jgi:hypothetical protein
MFADLNETRKDILNDIEENIKWQITNKHPKPKFETK